MPEINALLKLQTQARQIRYRLPIVISGDHDWGLQQAQELLSHQTGYILWLGDLANHTANSNVATIDSAKQQLGREWDHVVYDAWSGLDPDALAAIAGTIRAGGLLILLCPSLQQWPDYNDPQYQRIAVFPYQAESLDGHYLNYMVQQLRHSDHVCIWQQDKGLQTVNVTMKPGQASSVDGITSDQQRAIAAIKHVVNGHRHRPALLTSDRGRGKSSAMGIAAAELLRQDIDSVLVTAPRPAAVESLFQHALTHLPGAIRQAGKIQWQDKQIEFIATDELIRNPRPTRLLLVDEAAAIPTPMLRRLLPLYPRIAFATTVHGYEGTGRAFSLRFEKELASHSDAYQSIKLEQAIRWAEGDPLEQFLFKTFMLDVELASLPNRYGEPVMQKESISELLQQPQRLRDIYALLNMAHYRTRPYDLRHLLDGPNIEIYTLSQGAQLLGTVMLAREAIEDTSLHAEIVQGRRRPRGHLIPQSLACHSGWREALNYRYGRIIRIAVHPDVQDQGLGSLMLRELAKHIEGLDFLAASFGATAPLLNFWQQNGFQTVRLGFHRETNSGLHALMMLKPLSEEAAQHQQHWQSRLQHQLPWLSANIFSQLEDELLHQLLHEPEESIRVEDNLRDVDDFIHGYRQYEACILGLQYLVQVHGLNRLDLRSATLIEDKLLRQLDWQTLASKHQLRGRREAEDRLRKAIETLQNAIQ